MQANKYRGSKLTATGLACLFSLASSHVQAVPLSIAQNPLYIGGSYPPNVMFLLDDSGSMSWSYMPDAAGNGNNPQALAYRSASYNGMYYDPNVIYTPPVDASGKSYPNADFTKAWYDGFNPNSTKTYWVENLTTKPSVFLPKVGPTFNLTNQFYFYDRGEAYYSFGIYNTGSDPIQPAAAHYYIYNPSRSASCPQTEPRAMEGVSPAPDACYERRNITTVAERQNFANWFSYYRTRMNSVKTAMTLAFNDVGQSSMRLGYGQINKGSSSGYGPPASTVDGVNSQKVIMRGVRPFQDLGGNNDFRKEFYTWMTKVVASGGTPSRWALDTVGQYFIRKDNQGPWGNTPWAPDSAKSTEHIYCRQNYAIFVSDGYWNEDPAATPGAQANNDGMDGVLMTSSDGQKTYQYKAVDPYKDGTSGTLADVAMYYWKTNLRNDLKLGVPTSKDDPAFWPHMTTFTVGLGIAGKNDPVQVFNAVATQSPPIPAWPVDTVASPISNKPAAVDDLLHAALNGHGGYYSVKNPNQFSQAMQSILGSINQRNGSASAVSANSSSLNVGALIYTASFNTTDWSGQIQAYEITNAKGETRPDWKMNTFDADRISTWDPVKKLGVAFNSTALPAELLATAGGADVVDWVRGSSNKEIRNGGTLRDRVTPLGDILNSGLVYTGPINYGYAQAIALSADARENYLAYVRGKQKAVFVGANDGMLHAYDADKGDSLSSYVPYGVLDKLSMLSRFDYKHRYYVDSTPAVFDAYLNGHWATLLVGSTGAGGRSYFALQIGDSSDKSITASAPIVKWELTGNDEDPNLRELGTTLGQATVGYSKAYGKWIAVFGNGYNSASQQASLFIVDAENGGVLGVLSTETGSAAYPNGLATPLAVDVTGDGAIDRVYAGDYYGNVWRFDLSEKGKPIVSKLFDRDDLSNQQMGKYAITAPLQARQYKDNTGSQIVYFGSGKLFAEGDQSDATAQTLYGVIDRCRSGDSCKSIIPKSLLVQQIEQTGTVAGTTVRTVTKNPFPDNANPQGFMLTLPDRGERVLGVPLVWSDRVIFTTVVPTSTFDPCQSGYSWLMELDPWTGGRLPFTTFDLDGDGSFDNNDSLGGEVVSGMKLSGIISPPVTLRSVAVAGSAMNMKYTMDSNGSLIAIPNQSTFQTGRQSWRQIR